MKNTKIISKTISKYDEDWPPSDASGFFAWFQAKLADVREEFRSTVQIDLSSNMDYDSDYATIKISYTRHATEEENVLRQQQDASNADSLRSYELRTLAELKAKYGENS